MSVIPITVFFSLLLAGTFVVLFAREQRRRFSSAERDSLLPLAEEQARTVRTDKVARTRSTSEGDHHHDHADGPDSGCRAGTRLPCGGCLKPLDRPAPSAPLS